MKYKTEIGQHHVIDNLKKIIKEDGRAIVEVHGVGGFTLKDDESIMIVNEVGGNHLKGCMLSTILHDRYNIIDNQLEENKRIQNETKKFTEDDEHEMIRIMQSSPVVHNLIMMYSLPINKKIEDINKKLDYIIQHIEKKK